jgi:uncharacterized membrane protein
MHSALVASLWLHVLAAAAWLGGAIFVAVILVPVLRRPGWRDGGLELVRDVARRFLWVVWPCFGLLIVTGIVNLVVRTGGLEIVTSGQFWSGSYGRVLAWKLALVGLILVLSTLHDFVLGPRAKRAAQGDPMSRETGRLRVAVRWIGRLTLLLGVLVIGFGVALARGWPFREP